MNKLASLFAALAVLPGIVMPSLAAPSNSLLIVPGKSIGKMTLGSNGANTLNRFGQPDVLDAGMMQTRQVWLAKGNPTATLYIHTTANSVIDEKPENGFFINMIRTSSASFHTTSGISVGSTRAQIVHIFPRVRRNQEIKDEVIYCDPLKGITFEFASNSGNARCIGITVFTPGGCNIIRSEDVSRLIKDNVSSAR